MITPLLFLLLLVTSVWAESTGLIFFRKVNDKFTPLTLIYNPGFSYFSTTPSKEPIPNFTFNKGSVSTDEEPNSGPVGFFKDTFGYGKAVTETPIELGGGAIVIKPQIFSCRDSKDDPVDFFSPYEIEGKFCDHAEIYLLPRDSGSNH